MNAPTPLTTQHPLPSERQQPELPGHRSSHLKKILDLDDFERAVRRRLPRAVYGYVAHGAETEATLRANRAAFDEWQLVTRILVGVEERNSRISLFGRDYAAPFGIAP